MEKIKFLFLSFGETFNCFHLLKTYGCGIFCNFNQVVTINHTAVMKLHIIGINFVKL